MTRIDSLLIIWEALERGAWIRTRKSKDTIYLQLIDDENEVRFSQQATTLEDAVGLLCKELVPRLRREIDELGNEIHRTTSHGPLARRSHYSRP